MPEWRESSPPEGPRSEPGPSHRGSCPRRGAPFCLSHIRGTAVCSPPPSPTAFGKDSWTRPLPQAPGSSAVGCYVVTPRMGMWSGVPPCVLPYPTHVIRGSGPPFTESTRSGRCRNHRGAACRCKRWHHWGPDLPPGSQLTPVQGDSEAGTRSRAAGGPQTLVGFLRSQERGRPASVSRSPASFLAMSWC